MLMASVKRLIFSLLGFVLSLVAVCVGKLYQPKGRLVEPPPRLSLWRHGYDTPKYSQDNELSCFPRKKKNALHKASLPRECSLCGETSVVAKKFHTQQITDDALRIVRTYQVGQKIKVGVLLITPTVHRGLFQFDLCQKCTPGEQETEKCFDRHILKALSLSRVDPSQPMEIRLAAASGDIPHEDGSLSEEIDILIERDDGKGLYSIPADLPPDTVLVIELQLPSDVSCDACVFRWKYFAGKHQRLYGCADVRISDPSAQWPNPDCMPESVQLEDKEVVVHRRHQMLPNNSAANIVAFKSSTEQVDLLSDESSSKRDKEKEFETTESANEYYPLKWNVRRQNIDDDQRLYGCADVRISAPSGQMNLSQWQNPDCIVVQVDDRNVVQLLSNRSFRSSSSDIVRSIDEETTRKFRKKRSNGNYTVIAYQVVCRYPYYFWETLNDGAVVKEPVTQHEEQQTISSGTDSTHTLTAFVLEEPKPFTRHLKTVWPLRSLAIFSCLSLMLFVFLDG